MKNFVRNTLLLLVFLMQGVVRAQIYPVQTFVQVTPPYNSYLPDYADPFTNQLRVLLTLTDFSVPSTQVKLRFSIEGSGYSLQSVNLIAFPTITLTPGVPVELSGSDLAPYLSTSNLVFSGLNPATYELSKILPEGPASICVEVVDVTSANQPVVGNSACAQTWFSLYDPPLLNTPFCGSEITPTDPQGILFSWTPLHMASPLSGSTEYEFELFEIRPNEGDPNVVVNSTLPIFSQTTTSTFLNYGIIEPPLQVGMSYVWRVKAKDPSLRNLYRNNGYSAVCTFTYGSIAGSLIAGIVLELNSNGTGVRQGLTWWNASDLFDSYTLELRKTGNPAYEWFPYTATEGNLKVNSLEPLTQYECRVKGIAGGAETEWSNTSTFTTQAQPNYACGSTVLPARSPLIKPLDYLLISNIVSVGQFEMVVTAAEPLALAGHFAGTGKINVPFIGLNLHVIYEDIFIDEDMVMRSGRVDVITDGIDAWLDDQAVIFIDGIINQPGGFEFNDDSTVTVFFGDQSLTFEFIEGQPLVFEDESGLIYTVYSDGRIEISGEITWDDDVLAGTANHQIRFEALHDQSFGFDKKTYLQWTRLYPCIRLSDNSLYFVSYKSVGASQTDQLVAYITSEETINTPTFKYEDGTVLSSEKINDTTYHVTVGNTNNSKFIYGYDDQGAKIGKSILSVYEPITRDIVLVPVNGSNVPADVETYLNATFQQANVQFNITQAPNYQNELYDLTADGLDAPDATLMQKYSTEMRTLRDDYFAANPANPDTYYLFIVPEMADDFKGYMVRGKAVGFIENNQPAHTYAHEIAHGAFGLEHTFPAIPTGSTTNLLDYTTNHRHLSHHQWLEIQNFNPVFSILDDEEDGGLQNVQSILRFYHDEQTYVDVNPDYAIPLLDGTSLKIEGLERVIFEISGKAYKFVANGIEYTAYFAEDILERNRYYNCGYFTAENLNYLRSIQADKNNLRAKIIELRFDGFISTEPSTIVQTKAPKVEYNYFTDCLCEQFWITPNQIDVLEYIETNADNWYYPTMIQYDYPKNEAITYENCSGICLDYSEFDVEGPAVNLFISLSKDIKNNEALSDLAEMVNHINDLAEGKTFAFYAEFAQSYDGRNYWYSLDDPNEVSLNGMTVDFFRDFNIYTLEKFNEIFPIISQGDKQLDLIFSTVNLWEFKINAPYYNAFAIDYTSAEIPHVKDWDPNDVTTVIEVIGFIEDLYNYQIVRHPELSEDVNFIEMNKFIIGVKADPLLWLANKLSLRTNIVSCFIFLGVFEPFEYQFSDLRTRRIVMRSNSELLKTAISTAESAGKAVPLSYDTDYDQYVAKFDTESAFYLGFEYLKMYAYTVFLPDALAVAVTRMQKVVSTYRLFKPKKGLNLILGGGGDDLLNAYKPGYSKESILAMPKGSRPDPSVYLKDEYITRHLSKFEDGAAYLVPKSALDNYGRTLIGRPDGQFVMTKFEMDNLLTKADGDLSVIELELGIPAGLWKNKDLVRIDIPNPKQLNVRMPSGNESGANELWLPGGKLPNKYSEAVVNQIPQNNYIETLIIIK